MRGTSNLRPVTVDFATFPAYFDVDTEDREEYLKGFFQGFFPWISSSAKMFGSVFKTIHCFNYDYFIEKYKPTSFVHMYDL